MVSITNTRTRLAPFSGADRGTATSDCTDSSTDGSTVGYARGPLTMFATDVEFWDPHAWSPPF